MLLFQRTLQNKYRQATGLKNQLQEKLNKKINILEICFWVFFLLILKNSSGYKCLFMFKLLVKHSTILSEKNIPLKTVESFT